MRRIISLTSIPSRFDQLDRTLGSLLRDEVDEVRLYIPKSYLRFPDWDGIPPDVPAGINIVRCEKDYGPATKVLPACSDLANCNAQVLFCDDDGLYPSGWADRLFRIQSSRSDQAVAVYVRPAQGYVPNTVTPLRKPQAWQLPIKYDVPYRLARLAHKLFGTFPPYRRPFALAGYGEIFFGVGGVVVRPEFFDNVAFDIPPEAWAVDDVWLSAQLARRAIPIYCPWRHPMPLALEHNRIDSLYDMEIEGEGRHALNRKAAIYCQEQFGIWSN